jgi:hypothetical protein
MLLSAKHLCCVVANHLKQLAQTLLIGSEMNLEHAVKICAVMRNLESRSCLSCPM